jgi:tRNA nucleotidyltransferase (CCA-adding enzyme)
MQTYRVGGSVRDELLGLNWHDADWVVVGATPQDMLDQGYQPVGKDFPVFLHPDTKEEYALARTERKTGPGYKGFDVHFAPDVTLEEDLLRRDLTINAMAMDENGQLVDPHGGQVDLQARLLRHVSTAFVEDPVRILRIARFAARFNDFSVANETNLLMQRMVADGEVDALVPERVWAELARGLCEAQPIRMIAVLSDCNALPILLPGLVNDNRLTDALQRCTELKAELASRFAVLALHTSNANPVDHISRMLRVPNECRDVALLATRHHQRIANAMTLDAEALLELASDLDGLRRPERVPLVMDAVLAGDTGTSDDAVARVGDAIHVARDVDAGAIARPLASEGPDAISRAIASARQQAIARLL